MTAAVIVLVVVALLLVLFLVSALKVAREYERGVVFRLGRLIPNPKGPGLFVLIPIVDRMVRVDLRTITLQIPPQEVITKDNVPVRDLADRTDDAPLGPWPALARRAPVRAREDQHDPAGDHRRADGAVGHQDLDRRGKGRRDPAGHAARDGPTGGGRARAARKGNRRRGRVPGVRASQGRGERDRGASGCAAAALP